MPEEVLSEDVEAWVHDPITQRFARQIEDRIKAAENLLLSKGLESSDPEVRGAAIALRASQSMRNVFAGRGLA